MMDKNNRKWLLACIGIPVLMVLLFLLQWKQIDPFLLLRKEILLCIGYIAALSDLREKRIPNKLVLVLLAAWVLSLLPQIFLNIDIIPAVLKNGLLGFAVSGVLFLLVYLVSRQGLGGGDVKLMAVAGLYLGLYGALPAILYGSILAALFSLILMAAKKLGRKDTIPLVPFLYLGILIVLFGA